MDDREQAAYDEVAALWKSTLDLVRARPGITTSQAAEALIRDAQWVAMEAPTRLEVRMALGALRGLGYVRCTARGHSLSWSLVPSQVLCWDKAPKAESTAERERYWGGGIPGAYAPNMDEQWMARWKARLAGQRSGVLRVEVRKTTSITRGYSAQVLLVVHEPGDVTMSMNGTAGFSPQDWADMQAAVGEARAAMAAWREAHPLAVKTCGQCDGGLVAIGRCNCGSPADESTGFMHERLCGYEPCQNGCWDKVSGQAAS